MHRFLSGRETTNHRMFFIETFSFFVSNRISFCCRRHSLVVLWIQIVCCTTFSYNAIWKWYLHLRIKRRKGISWKSSYFCQTSTNCHLHHSCSPYMASITVKPTSMCVYLRVPHCFIFQVFMCFRGFIFMPTFMLCIDGSYHHYIRNAIQMLRYMLFIHFEAR